MRANHIRFLQNRIYRYKKSLSRGCPKPSIYSRGLQPQGGGAIGPVVLYLKCMKISRFFLGFSVAVVVSLAFLGIPVLFAQISAPVEHSQASFDFGVKNVGLLPISPLYFLKEWRRDIVRAMATDPYVEASFESQILNEKAAEVQKVDEFRPGDADSMKRALENYESSLVRLGHAIGYVSAVSPEVMSEGFLSRLLSEGEAHTAFFEALASGYAADEGVTGLLRDIRGKLVSVIGAAFKDADPAVVSPILGSYFSSEGTSTPSAAAVFISEVANKSGAWVISTSTEASTTPGAVPSLSSGTAEEGTTATTTQSAPAL